MTEPWPYAHLTEKAKEFEMHETPSWAVESILDAEILNDYVVDPCCGRGVLAEAAARRGHTLWAFDIYDWGYPSCTPQLDFLSDFLGTDTFWGATVLMNPPFSLATEFVEKALDLGARKILCFQRFAWWESAKRRDFWNDHPPTRVYVCGDRATCWRIDVPPEMRMNGTTTAHAWFVWEANQPAGTTLGHIWKGEYK